MAENKTMTIEEAIEKLNVLSSYDTAPEKREEYKKCINVIIRELKKYKLAKAILEAIYDEDKKFILDLKEHK